MKKSIIMISLFILAGCSTTMNTSDFVNKSELKALNDRMEWLIYDTRCENCFQLLDICRLQKVKTDKECWSRHEACVVNAYREYKFYTK